MNSDPEFDRFMEEHVRPCVGCGYCCRKARCVHSFTYWPTHDPRCPALYWDEGQRKWRCRLAAMPDLYKALSMGEGCCSPLNTDRQKIPTPEEVAWTS